MEKTFLGQILCSCAFGANIRSYIKQRARHGTPFLQPPPPPSAGVHVTPPPPRRAIFRLPIRPPSVERHLPPLKPATPRWVAAARCRGAICWAAHDTPIGMAHSGRFSVCASVVRYGVPARGQPPKGRALVTAPCPVGPSHPPNSPREGLEGAVRAQGHPPPIPLPLRGRYQSTPPSDQGAFGGGGGGGTLPLQKAVGGLARQSAPVRFGGGRSVTWVCVGTCAWGPHGTWMTPEASWHLPPCVTFHRVVVSLRGPGQSPVRPFACCVGSLRSVSRCGRCSCWCRFRVRGAQWLVCWGCAGCGMVCRLRVSGPIIGVLRMCWLLPGSFDCFCCPHTSVHRPSIACLAVFLCGPGALFLHALSGPSTICPFPPHGWSAPDGLPLLLRKQPIWAAGDTPHLMPVEQGLPWHPVATGLAGPGPCCCFFFGGGSTGGRPQPIVCTAAQIHLQLIPSFMAGPQLGRCQPATVAPAAPAPRPSLLSQFIVCSSANGLVRVPNRPGGGGVLGLIRDPPALSRRPLAVGWVGLGWVGFRPPLVALAPRPTPPSPPQAARFDSRGSPPSWHRTCRAA